MYSFNQKSAYSKWYIHSIFNIYGIEKFRSNRNQAWHTQAAAARTGGTIGGHGHHTVVSKKKITRWCEAPDKRQGGSIDGGSTRRTAAAPQ